MRVHNDELFLAVGSVVRAHGRGGKIKVRIFSGEADGLSSVSSVFFREKDIGRIFPLAEKVRGAFRFEIENVQDLKGFSLLTLKGVQDMNQAEHFVGMTLFLLKEELPETGDDEYYYFELVGYRVEDESGNFLGEVARVVPSPAHDILEIRTRGGEKMVPFVARFVPEVRRDERVIVLSPIRGMLDDEV
jgi:16S rRNA processing protein RimM